MRTSYTLLPLRGHQLLYVMPYTGTFLLSRNSPPTSIGCYKAPPLSLPFPAAAADKGMLGGEQEPFSSIFMGEKDGVLTTPRNVIGLLRPQTSKKTRAVSLSSLGRCQVNWTPQAWKKKKGAQLQLITRNLFPTLNLSHRNMTFINFIYKKKSVEAFQRHDR